MSKTAIIIGATGATGSHVLTQLLEDNRYSRIKLFSRSSVGIEHMNLEEHIVDLFKPETFADRFTADEVYCCIGTTKAKTPDKDTYHNIDYGIPVAAAKLAKQNGIDTFIVVSAVGSNAESGIFYVRTKGEMERDVLAQQIPKTHILRPALIVAQRKETRIMEKLFAGIWALLNPLLFGSMSKYRSIKAKDIAHAMIRLANGIYTQTIIESDVIQRISDGKE